MPKRIERRIRLRKKPRQARAKATTEAIIEATFQVLLSEGYGSLTTTRVAERAGVSVGTLYQYFPDRRSLVMALKARYFAQLLSAMEGVQALPAAGDVRGVLRAVLSALVRVKRESAPLSRALRAPMAELDGAGFVRETLEQFAAVVLAKVAPFVPPDESLPRRVLLLVAAVEGALAYAVFESPAWLNEDWFVDDLVTLAGSFVAPR